MPVEAAPALLISRLDIDRIEAMLEHEDPAAHAGLRAELDRAEVREPHEMPDDVVTMNSTARFADESSGEEHEMTLVFPRDADSLAGRISILAPVGSALLGLRVGQNIDWQVPGGRIRLGVRAIRHEVAGDTQR